MKTNNKLRPQIPYTPHAYQRKRGLFVLPTELHTPKKQMVKAPRSQDVREMAQALMVWLDDGGAEEGATVGRRNSPHL